MRLVCRWSLVVLLAVGWGTLGRPELRVAGAAEPESAPAQTAPADHASAAVPPQPAATPEAKPLEAPMPPPDTPLPPEMALPEMPPSEAAVPELPPLPIEGPAADAELEIPPKDVRLTFNFRFQPWEDVLDWFAEQAGLSLVMNAAPTGTLNYTDDRTYTPAEAIDLLNSVLLTKGYTLVLRGRMLMLINLEDGIPPNLVSTVPAEELDQRGEFELVSTLFPLDNLQPDEAEQEIKKLIGPQGSVVVLPKAQQVLVTETAGRLRTIREVLQRADNPGSAGAEQVQWFDLPAASSEEVLALLRQMFNIPAGQNAAADGSIRMAWDPLSMRLLVSGRGSKLEQIGKVLQVIVPADTADPESRIAPASLQLEVHDVYPADPDTVLKVMQTLLAGSPGARLATDPKSGNLIAMARPNEQATIRATLDQIRRDAQRIEVLQLRIADPQSAAQAIQKLFGADGKAPNVQADVTTRQLLVRGNEPQLQQIRSLLEQMGETDLASAGASGGGTVRVLPITGRAARSALERLEEIWPTMHQNRIRVVTPSAVIPSMRPSTPEPELEAPRQPPPPPLPPAKPSSAPAPVAPESAPADPAQRDRTARTATWARIVLVADAPVAVEKPASQAPPAEATKEASPIIVAPGPGGVVIASDDVKALDAFETMLRTLVGTATAGNPNMTIYYLKHAKAASVAETLDSVFGGGTLPREFYTQRQQQQQPGMPPGMPMGPGGPPGANSVPPANQLVQITPDSRLNALIVRASPADLETMEELLKILDQKESPEEILAQPKPRLIPVYNTQAEEIAEIIKQVYQDRIGSASSGSSPGGPPNPMQMYMMMRGRSSRGGAAPSRSTADDTQRMSIGVDARSNSVIVAAPEPLFEEVRQLVEQLDSTAVASNETVRVVTLHKASLDAVEHALSSLGGDSVQVSRSPATSGSTSQSRSYGRSYSSRSSSGGSSSSGYRSRSRYPSSSYGGTPSGGPSYFGRPR